jgi:hypothetical protein
VPGHHQLPVGRGRDGRGPARGDGGRFKSRGEVVLASTDRHPDPPAPPRWLVDPRAVELYMEAWQTPVSVLWAPHNADDVGRLAELELMLEGGDRRSWIFSAITTLRTNLWLLPKPMRTAGIRIDRDDGDEPVSSWRDRLPEPA